MPSYSSQGAAQLITTATAALPCPAVVDAGDALEARVIHNGSAIGAAPSGWTLQSVQPAAGGLRGGLYTKIAVGNEDGTTVNFTGQTGATTGIGYITRVVPTTPGNTLTIDDADGFADADATTTAFGGSGGSWTSTVNHLITHGAVTKAPSGTYTASNTGPTITQAGATVTSTARFGTRAATNTLWYGFQTASISSGGTGTPTFASTCVGANGTGVGLFGLILESAPPSNTPPTANAGADQTNIEPWSTVTLNGSGSSDPDGTVTNHTWTQTAGTTVTLSGSGTANRTFTAPATMAGETLTFSLVVTDDDGANSTADTVNITILPATEARRVSGGTAWQPERMLTRSAGAWI